MPAASQSQHAVMCSCQVMNLIRLAERKVKELSEMLQASLKAHDVERVQARIRRHNLTPAVTRAQNRAVTVLNSNDAIGIAALPDCTQVTLCRV